MRWLDSITDSVDRTLSKLLGIVKGREVWYTAVHQVKRVRPNLAPEQQIKP